MSLNRTTLGLLSALTALAALTGVAQLTAPDGTAAGSTAETERLPVEQSTLVCPQPAGSEVGETVHTAFTPESDLTRDSDGKGTAALLPAADTLEGGSNAEGGSEAESEDAKEGEEPRLPLTEPGVPVVAEDDSGDLPALTGTATGPLAPGWTVQQTTAISSGAGRGLHGVSCSAPDTDFWFAGVSTAEERNDYVHLTNPDGAAAIVDLGFHGKDGAIESDSGTGINVPGRSTVAVLLSTLTPEPVVNPVLHVGVRAGRIGAQVQALDDDLGGDWIAPAAAPSETLVLPGIPADAEEVRLVAFAPGERDAELDVKLAGPTSSISPAGQETLNVKSGMVTAVDLGDLTKGEPGSLVLTAAEGRESAPVVAGLRVLRGTGDDQESAFVPAVSAVTDRATAAGNGDGDAALSLVAPDGAAEVRVTASAGSGGGEPASKTYQLKAGTTTLVEDLAPEGGEGRFAWTVERLSGGPVHASRMLRTDEDEDVPAFTVQVLPDDRGVVQVPEARQDLGVLGD